MKNILIVNDDGINASGLVRLARAAQKYGKVWVVAPAMQQSGASHSINLHTPMRCERVDFPVEGVEAFSLAGSPADCARVGALKIVPKKPDLLLSGINFGYNAGTDTMYSGTVGGAMEGAFQGIPSVAVSEGTKDGFVITDLYLEQVLDRVVSDIMDKPVEKYVITNINFPTCKPEELKGIKWDVKVSKGLIYTDDYTCKELSDGSCEYMVKGQFGVVAEPDSDLTALFDNYITVGKLKNLE